MKALSMELERMHMELQIFSSQTYDLEGNFICLTVKTTSSIFNLLTLYEPNIDNPSFYREIKKCYPEE